MPKLWRRSLTQVPYQQSMTGLAVPQRSIFDRMNDTVLEDSSGTSVDSLVGLCGGWTNRCGIIDDCTRPRLTHDAQMKARELMQSDDPEKAVFICFAARRFQWKSWVLSIRKLFTHVDPRVGAAAVSAVGELTDRHWHHLYIRCCQMLILTYDVRQKSLIEGGSVNMR